MSFASRLAALWTPPADRRLASALAADASPLPTVALVSANDGAALRRRLHIDEQRHGIRTPWQPVGLRWGFEDMEPVWQAAEIGNMDPIARVSEAMRSEAVISGLMDVRVGFVAKPATFAGDPYLCALLRGRRPTFDAAGRMVTLGEVGLFRRMHPTAALRDLVYTQILAGVSCGEYVDDPITGIPVLHTRDLHRLRYDWGERCWKYRGTLGEYVVDPGNGRWILFCGKSTHRPWRTGSWLPLMLAFVVMTTATYDAARFQAKNADPLKWIDVPDSAPPDEVERYQDFVANWWERAPGIVLRWGAKAGLTETNGVGHHIFGTQREWAKQQILFAATGSMGTAGEAQGIFNDASTALELMGGIIQDTADALAECLTAQGIAPALLRMGLIRHRDDAPTCSWDTRTPARKLAEAKAAGEVCDVIAKLDAIGAPRGKRVDVDAFFGQCGMSIPWQGATVTTELQDAEGNALWSGQAEIEGIAPVALPAATVPDSVVAQTDPAGSLE